MLQLASQDFGNMAWRMDSCEDPFNRKGWPADKSAQASGRSRASSRTESLFGFAQNRSPSHQSTSPSAEGIEPPVPSVSGSIQVVSRSPWSPQRSDDPLHGFRASIQSGELSKFADSAMAGQIDHLHMFAPGVHSHNSNNNNHSGTSTSHNNNNNNSNNNNSNSANHDRATDHGKHRNSVSSDSADSLEYTQTTWSAVVQKNPRPVRQQRTRGPRPSKAFTVTMVACCATPKLKLTCSCCNEESLVKVKEELRPRVIPVATSQLGFCRFCQQNGDPSEIYQSHSLRSDDGKVTCPVLREYNCPICNNGGGDFAHTIKYCPLARKAKPNH